ncbi:DUF1761 domain-containing protein [Hyphococcus sp.]|uniref:DUF1761 domain-containing protein n=1 Tax=Hyphococcus sp. TaxID=2038636 RepID=UPI0035C68F3E
MPKILGLNIVAVIVASVAFFLVGWLWYGILFMDAYMESMGIATDEGSGAFDIWMAGGFLITILQVIGLGLVMKWKGDVSPMAGAMTAVVLWFFLALPFAMYAYLYGPAHDSTMMMIDASHLLVGWVVSAVVLRLIK